MTLWQCLVLALMGYLSSIYSPWLALGGWYTLGRPLIAGLAVGIVLGDVTTGILLGCAVQTLFIGLVTPGGSMPADVNFAAWIGIPLAMVASADANFALALSMPLSFLGVFAVLLTVTFNSVFVHRQDRLIREGQLEKAIRIPVVGQITNFVMRFIPILVCNYFGAMFIPQFVDAIPIEVIGILAAFGQILPLIGFATLMKYVYKKPLDLVFYLIGFVLSAALHLPILPTLIFAVLFAYIDYSGSSGRETLMPPAKADDQQELVRLLSRKDVFRCYRDWLVWNLSVQNMERMEGPAIIRMLGIVREKLYPGDRQKQQQLLERHEPFFNTEPYLGCIVPGIVLGMEEENARNDGQTIPDELLTGIKAALMGPAAGIGDSLYVGTLIPILLSVAIGISHQSGSLLGPVLYIVAHLGIMMPLTWFLFYRGYSMGLDSAQSILEGGLKDKLTRAMNIIGLTVVGAITSEYVTIRTGWVMMQGEEIMLDMNAALDGILPNIITLALALATFWLMSKKKVKIGWMFLIYLVFSVVALLIGLMNVG